MADERLPSFDLVVATVDRVAELERLLASVQAQTHRAVRVLLVDQNEDDRLEPVLQEQRSFNLVRLHAQRGLSRARNAALEDISADLVAFPDDDCVFASDLLERVALRFAGDRALDGLTGRAVDESRDILEGETAGVRPVRSRPGREKRTGWRVGVVVHQ